MMSAKPGTTATVLVIEDDDDIARALETLLTRAGYGTMVETDGRLGLRRFHATGPDLVILDVGLPSLDGWTLLDRIRELSSAPILMLTALDSEMDKVRGLRSGADDYLTKPFGNQELLARVEAILRRGGGAGGGGAGDAGDGRGEGNAGNAATASTTTADGPPMATGSENLGARLCPGHEGYEGHGVLIDLDCHRVEVGGIPVSLTRNEFRLVEVLLQHRGNVLSTGQLLQLAWRDPTATGPGRVKFTVLRLRRKLAGVTGGEGPIETVRGYGYRFRPRDGEGN